MKKKKPSMTQNNPTQNWGESNLNLDAVAGLVLEATPPPLLDETRALIQSRIRSLKRIADERMDMVVLHRNEPASRDEAEAVEEARSGGVFDLTELFRAEGLTEYAGLLEAFHASLSPQAYPWLRWFTLGALEAMVSDGSDKAMVLQGSLQDLSDRFTSHDEFSWSRDWQAQYEESLSAIKSLLNSLGLSQKTDRFFSTTHSMIQMRGNVIPRLKQMIQEALPGGEEIHSAGEAAQPPTNPLKQLPPGGNQKVTASQAEEKTESDPRPKVAFNQAFTKAMRGKEVIDLGKKGSFAVRLMSMLMKENPKNLNAYRVIDDSWGLRKPLRPTVKGITKDLPAPQRDFFTDILQDDRRMEGPHYVYYYRLNPNFRYAIEDF
jgi:hypothetical protein